MRSHKLEKKSAKKKRGFSKEIPVRGVDARRIKKLLGRRAGR